MNFWIRLHIFWIFHIKMPVMYFFMVTLRYPFYVAWINIRLQYLQPAAILFRFWKRGWITKDHMAQNKALVQRWVLYTGYLSSLRIKEERLKEYKLANEFQEIIGSRINPL